MRSGFLCKNAEGKRETPRSVRGPLERIVERTRFAEKHQQPCVEK